MKLARGKGVSDGRRAEESRRFLVLTYVLSNTKLMSAQFAPNAPHHLHAHHPITRAHAQCPYVLCNKSKGSVSSTPCLKKWIVSMSCLHVLECGGKTKFKQHEPSLRRKTNLSDDDDTPCALHSRKRHCFLRSQNNRIKNHSSAQRHM